jgi:hypothetical protein
MRFVLVEAWQCTKWAAAVWLWWYPVPRLVQPQACLRAVYVMSSHMAWEGAHAAPPVRITNDCAAGAALRAQGVWAITGLLGCSTAHSTLPDAKHSFYPPDSSLACQVDHCRMSSTMTNSLVMPWNALILVPAELALGLQLNARDRLNTLTRLQVASAQPATWEHAAAAQRVLVQQAKRHHGTSQHSRELHPGMQHRCMLPDHCWYLRSTGTVALSYTCMSAYAVDKDVKEEGGHLSTVHSAGVHHHIPHSWSSLVCSDVALSMLFLLAHSQRNLHVLARPCGVGRRPLSHRVHLQDTIANAKQDVACSS